MTKRLKNLNILITGANGFIGKRLTNELFTQGATVIAVIHKNNQIELPIENIIFDGSFESLIRPLENRKIDLIIHLATHFSSSHKAEQINELIDSNIKFGTYILELVRQKNVPYFINTSTYAQFFDHKEYNPQNLYAATKQAFEMIMKYYEESLLLTRFVTLELSDTYGPGDIRPKFINLILDAIKKNEVFNMSFGDQEICYIYVDDVVDAFIKCIVLMENNIIQNNSKYSVYADEVYKLKDLVNYVCTILDVKLDTNIGYYPYRDREIMTFLPSFQKLPDWSAKYTLKDGITHLK